jgi:predicted TIM-barrel fold metal-dependent hydrolase
MYTDIHHHMLTPGLIEALGHHGLRTVGGEALPPWKPEMSLAIMDLVGIERAILSCPIPLDFLDSSAAESMAREVNEYAADYVSRWPGRFGYFASLPLPDVAAAVDEATRGGQPADKRGPRPLPGIRFVFTHSGSCVPSVAHKLINHKPMVAAYTSYIEEHGQPPRVDELLDQLAAAEDTARRQIAELYFDTALSTAGPTLDALTSLVPTSHILLGTDFPFGQEIGLQYTLRGIDRYPGFSDDDRAAVLADNANDLLAPETPATP